jgi:hypothetical protein
MVDGDSFVLPAAAWKDNNLLDLVLSIKGFSGNEDSTEDLFYDLMLENYETKMLTGGIGSIQYLFKYSKNPDKIGWSAQVDLKIEAGHSSVDENI